MKPKDQGSNESSNLQLEQSRGANPLVIGVGLVLGIGMMGFGMVVSEVMINTSFLRILKKRVK